MHIHAVLHAMIALSYSPFTLCILLVHEILNAMKHKFSEAFVSFVSPSQGLYHAISKVILSCSRGGAAATRWGSG